MEKKNHSIHTPFCFVILPCKFTGWHFSVEGSLRASPFVFKGYQYLGKPAIEKFTIEYEDNNS